MRIMDITELGLVITPTNPEHIFLSDDRLLPMGQSLRETHRSIRLLTSLGDTALLQIPPASAEYIFHNESDDTERLLARYVTNPYCKGIHALLGATRLQEVRTDAAVPNYLYHSFWEDYAVAATLLPVDPAEPRHLRSVR